MAKTPQTPTAGFGAPSPEPPKTKKKHAIVRTEKGTFKKGHTGNPNGSRKQIFHTSKPWKQAIMRELRDRSDREQADELQKIAARLIDSALRGLFPMAAITEIGNRLDGSPEKEPAAPQQNTLQIMMNSIRVLNLTPEQRNELARQLAAQQHPTIDGGSEPS